MATLKKLIQSAPRMRGSLPVKAQTGGSLGTIWTGPANENPGVVKARVDKAKAEANLAKYKKKSDAQKAKAIEKAKLNKAKDGKWMQKAAASIKKRGTKGVCTGAKFGGPTCKPGTKRYSLAKTFKSIAKKKK